MDFIRLGIIGLGVQGGLYTRILMDDQPEGMFKAFAKALDEAVSFDPRITGVLSTKGTL